MRKFVTAVLLVIGLGATSCLSAQGQNARPDAMVFFDFGKLEIQRDYAATLDAAATGVKNGPGTTILVEGHSDRAGSSTVNRRSSLLRANAVRDYLLAQGVRPDAIEVQAWGEDRPLVATADGVREAQNRRVDVRRLPARGL